MTTANPISHKGKLYDVYSQGAGIAKIRNAVETDVIIRDASIDLGKVQLDDNTTDSISIINIGKENKTLTGTIILNRINTGNSYSSCAHINPQTITIPPNSAKCIELVAETNHPKGIYSGRLLFTDSNSEMQYTAIFGYVAI